MAAGRIAEGLRHGAGLAPPLLELNEMLVVQGRLELAQPEAPHGPVGLRDFLPESPDIIELGGGPRARVGEGDGIPQGVPARRGSGTSRAPPRTSCAQLATPRRAGPLGSTEARTTSAEFSNTTVVKKARDRSRTCCRRDSSLMLSRARRSTLSVKESLRVCTSWSLRNNPEAVRACFGSLERACEELEAAGETSPRSPSERRRRPVAPPR